MALAFRRHVLEALVIDAYLVAVRFGDGMVDADAHECATTTCPAVDSAELPEAAWAGGDNRHAASGREYTRLDPHRSSPDP
jgi:hypothetical protein